ncbi:MAG: DUF4249 family protein [Bacteroidota bacterium]
MRIINKFKAVMLLFLAPFLSQSCEEVPVFEDDDQLPVVEGFLYANQPVNGIAVSKVLPFGTTDEEVALSGLDISIIHDGTTYQLLESEDKLGRYEYPGNDLMIYTGGQYDLEFDFNGRQVTSSTNVPPPPVGLSISTNDIFLPQLVERRDIRTLLQNLDNNLLVEWENPDGDYYFLVVENIETDPEPIDLNNILNFNFQFTSSPTQNDFFTLRPLTQFTQFGTHRIIVYRVNEAYALLYETLEQDSRNLNEPFSNITNGVGIFSGFASDTLLLEVRKR